MRILATGAMLFVTAFPASLLAQAPDASLERLRLVLDRQHNLSIPFAPPPPGAVVRTFGMLSLAVPDGSRGEFVRIVLPVGDLLVRGTRAIGEARQRRAERGARAEVAGALLAAGFPLAQDRPNFSGEWLRIDPPPSDASGELVVAHEAMWLRVRGPSPGPRSDTHALGVVGGTVGAVGPGSAAPTSKTDIAAVWQEGVLSLTSSKSVRDADDRSWTVSASHEERWSLDSSGRLIVIVTDRESPNAATTARFVYERKK
jgi:hypothetical protein